MNVSVRLFGLVKLAGNLGTEVMSVRLYSVVATQLGGDNGGQQLPLRT